METQKTFIQKAWLCLVAIYMFTNLTVSAGTLSGTVTNEQTGQPIYDALVTVLKGQKLITSSTTDQKGTYSIENLADGLYELQITAIDYAEVFKPNVIVKTNDKNIVDIAMTYIGDENEPIGLPEIIKIEEDVVMEMDMAEYAQPAMLVKEEVAYKKQVQESGKRYKSKSTSHKRAYCKKPASTYFHLSAPTPTHFNAIPPEAKYNTESYDVINENGFKNVTNEPLSTFSIDVDKASYANVRRMLNYNQMPHKDAVRIEEMINYFSYDYPEPTTDDPFSTIMEYGECPWNTDHQLAMIGIKGKSMQSEAIPASNLVFLIDVSGSMGSTNKLPLLKKSFKVLVDNLRPQDKVAIVVYAGAAGAVLPSTSGADKQTILSALNKLESGGSTAGGAGITLAYKIAQDNFIEGGNNRVIMATDGDFNTGESSDAQMVRLIEEKRKGGVFLSILGFGMGNYKDSKMEQLSNAGNGNYAYIDNRKEANKTFGTELWGTLFTIAKDVKIQIEFNPAKVKAYRLIGYENRLLNNEDFNDDTKDAGEIGSGHTVTAIYEIIPTGSEEQVKQVDPLQYQSTKVITSENLMTLKLRYKKPDGHTSSLITHYIKQSDIDNVTDNFYFTASVAEFGMLLRDSEFKKNASYDQVIALASQAKGLDTYGYRTEFLDLVRKAKQLSIQNP